MTSKSRLPNRGASPAKSRFLKESRAGRSKRRNLKSCLRKFGGRWADIWRSESCPTCEQAGPAECRRSLRDAPDHVDRSSARGARTGGQKAIALHHPIDPAGTESIPHHVGDPRSAEDGGMAVRRRFPDVGDLDLEDSWRWVAVMDRNGLTVSWRWDIVDQSRATDSWRFDPGRGVAIIGKSPPVEARDAIAITGIIAA